MEKTDAQNPPNDLVDPWLALYGGAPQDNSANQQIKSQSLDIAQERSEAVKDFMTQFFPPTENDQSSANPFQDPQSRKRQNERSSKKIGAPLMEEFDFAFPGDPVFSEKPTQPVNGEKEQGSLMQEKNPLLFSNNERGLKEFPDPRFEDFAQMGADFWTKDHNPKKGEEPQNPENPENPENDKSEDSTPTNMFSGGQPETPMKETKPLIDRGGKANQIFPEKKGAVALVKRVALGYSDNKDLRESDIQYKDLVPEGVDSVIEMKRSYEKEMNKKKYGNLKCFPESRYDEKCGVIFTPDYQFIITTAKFHSIKIFHVETKQLVREIKEAHNDTITALAMTPDGKYITSASLDKSIKIFDFASKELVHHFKDIHNEKISAIAITSDNKYLISGSWDKSVKVFDLIKKQQLHHFQNFHQDRITCLVVTSDHLIITASSDKSVKIFNLRTKENIHIFQAVHNDDILSIAICNNPLLIVTGSADNSVKILDIPSKKEIYHMKDEIAEGYQGNKFHMMVTQVALSADGQALFVGLGDRSVMMFDMKTKKKLKHFEDPYPRSIKTICGLAISRDTDFIVECVTEEALEIIEIEEKKKISPKSESSSFEHLVSMSFSSDNKTFATATSIGGIQVFDCETQKEIKSYSKIKNHTSFLSNEKLDAFIITPNNKFLISAGNSHEGNALTIFHQENGDVYHKFKAIQKGLCKALAVTSDSKYVASAAASGDLVIVDIEAKTIFHDFQNIHNDEISSIAITPDDKFIVTGCKDKSIKLIDIASKQEIYHWKEAHQNQIQAVAVTPNNEFIISASYDLSIKIFDIETKRLIHDFYNAHRSQIRQLSVSSDSRFLASCSADIIKVFDIVTRQLVYNLQVYQGPQSTE